MTLTKKSSEGGEKIMDKELDFCPECLRKENQAELTKRDHQHELEKATQERDSAKQQLAATVNGHISPTADLFEHWKGCTDCAPKLEAMLKPFVSDAYQKGQNDPNMDGVRAKLKADGWYPPIKNIVIKPKGR